jgi:hypothetical protein
MIDPSTYTHFILTALQLKTMSIFLYWLISQKVEAKNALRVSWNMLGREEHMDNCVVPRSSPSDARLRVPQLTWVKQIQTCSVSQCLFQHV